MEGFLEKLFIRFRGNLGSLLISFPCGVISSAPAALGSEGDKETAMGAY